jgi:hypothetical protein
LAFALVAALVKVPAAQAQGPGVKGATRATCSWDRPGANPYRGELGAAVDRYTDIPVATRAALKKRMAEQRYDDLAVIGRDHITGAARYHPALRDMHFGNGTVCRTVTRERWPDKAEERGLVYCEGSHCLIVPTVCRNVSRVTRVGPQAASLGTPGGDTQAAAAGKPEVPAEDAELRFDAPGAGRALGAAGDFMTGEGPQALTPPGAAFDAPLPLLRSPAAAALPGSEPLTLGADSPNSSPSFADVAQNSPQGTPQVAPPAADAAGAGPSAGGGAGGPLGPGIGSFSSGVGGGGGGGNANTLFTVPARPLAPLQDPLGSGVSPWPETVAPAAAIPENRSGLLLVLGLLALAFRLHRLRRRQD